MEIIAIVACDLNGAIGKDGALPWKLPSELARFKQRTMGSPIIMGRKTFQSIARPLPGRLNIVLTRSSAFEEVCCVPSIEDALAACGPANEVFIIGGGEVYRQMEPHLDLIEMSVVQTVIENADTHFATPAGFFIESESPAQQQQGDEHAWLLRVLRRTQ